MVSSALMTSARTGTGRDDWATPQEIFDWFDQKYNFDLDVCASPFNNKHERFYGLGSDVLDAFEVPWLSSNFCNPPYSQLLKWVQHAAGEAALGHKTLMLFAARTDTVAFHMARKYASDLYFFEGRITFLGLDGKPVRNKKTGQVMPAPFPSVAMWISGSSPKRQTIHWPKTREIMCAKG